VKIWQKEADSGKHDACASIWQRDNPKAVQEKHAKSKAQGELNMAKSCISVIKKTTGRSEKTAKYACKKLGKKERKKK